MAKKKQYRPKWQIVLMGVVLFMGLGLGLLTAFKSGADHAVVANATATGSQVEADRAVIAAQYLSESSTMCTDKTDPIKPADRVAVFYKYLRVNSHDNRAVIRGCGNHDTLLAKINGTWQKTDVNISLDTSANPIWQAACDITDITRTDTKVRPENNSIDAANLKMCMSLQNNKILRIQEL